MIAAAAWIFGCAAYFYARFTWVFVDENGDAIRDVGARIADLFARSNRAR